MQSSTEATRDVCRHLGSAGRKRVRGKAEEGGRSAGESPGCFPTSERRRVAVEERRMVRAASGPEYVDCRGWCRAGRSCCDVVGEVELKMEKGGGKGGVC